MTPKNKATIYRTNSTREILDHQPTLEEAQEIVGGYITLLGIRKSNHTLILNEDGGPLNLPLNYQAASIFGPPATPYTRFFGNIIDLEGWKTVGPDE